MINFNKNQYKIIDAHLHLPWQNEYSTIEEKLERLQKEMNNNGVDYGILIADSILESNIGNNEECLAAVKNTDNLFLIFGFSPLQRLNEQLAYAESLLKEKKIVGIKLFPDHEDFYMNDFRIKDVINICIKYQVPILVHTEWNLKVASQYSHPNFIKELAQSNPDLKIICCHMWNPRIIEGFKITKDLLNVYYDISSFSMGKLFLKDHPESLFPRSEKASQYVNYLMKTIPERVMFGSDYGSLSIEEHIEIVLNAGLNDKEIRKILYENANKIFNLAL